MHPLAPPEINPEFCTMYVSIRAHFLLTHCLHKHIGLAHQILLSHTQTTKLQQRINVHSAGFYSVFNTCYACIIRECGSTFYVCREGTPSSTHLYKLPDYFSTNLTSGGSL